MYTKYVAISIESMKKLAGDIAGAAKALDVILLSGAVGAGKTTFSKFFINAFLPNEVVSSPTFNLVNLYHYENFAIWHFDLYRIKSFDELYELGMEEALSTGITIIEWPELVFDFIKLPLEIRINHNVQSNNRDIIIKSNINWQKRLRNLEVILN
ncbi:tRNA (adenosine(37)-N6)-threonylcarbamoyltransferase complex ATPase subunit type 1 TsaE [Wolbachia endosymbiont of Pentidionis agamae]|uniref:tRNA (adenosine(37)-N6)-threonylcarbamoyltransferase complex ATPase subunit type 1 TsaE n=1 Tax=Wolbachia endosymbiont of Pentidionis agamae TaxID=3110435 RepID=UPI002FD755FB